MKVLVQKVFLVSVSVLIVALGVSGQIAQNSTIVETESVPPEPLQFSDLNQRIHYGDLIEVDVVGSTEFDWRGSISPEGFLSGLQFTESPVFALCKTGAEVAKQVADSYGKFLKAPVVNVEILDRSKRPLATLYGAVLLPQRFKLEKQVNLRELIVLSGGFSENTGAEIEIYRQPSAACIGFEGGLDTAKAEALRESEFLSIQIQDILKGESAANPPIFYGDMITVKSSSPVYVIGDVARPGPIPLTERLSVQRAIDSAGGINGQPGEFIIRVFRRKNGGTEVIEFGSEESEKPDMTQFPLKDYDIVEVFGKGIKKSKLRPVILGLDTPAKNIEDLPVRVVN